MINYTPKRWRKIVGYTLLSIGFAYFIGIVWFISKTLTDFSTYPEKMNTIFRGQLEGVILILSWGCYTLKYKYSDIKPWKKVVKVIGYILLSITILAIMNDIPTWLVTILYMPYQFFIMLLVYAILLAISIVLIRLSRKHLKKSNPAQQQPTTNEETENVEL